MWVLVCFCCFVFLFCFSSVKSEVVDIFISDFDEDYRKALNNYNKLLKQKNFILKTSVDNYQLDAIDDVLSKKIQKIVKNRVLFSKQINEVLEGIYHKIFSLFQY